MLKSIKEGKVKMDKFRLMVFDSTVGTFYSVKKAKEKALEINPDVEFILDRNSFKQGANIYYSTTSSPSMRIEYIQEPREETIQRWVKKTQKMISRMTPEYNRLYDSDIAEEHKLAEFMSDALYLQVPEDIRDDVYKLLDEE